jgi:hypothetical protein
VGPSTAVPIAEPCRHRREILQGNSDHALCTAALDNFVLAYGSQ